MARLHILSSSAIDTLRYTQVLDAAKAPAYAYPWYLDALNLQWSVLVVDDYAAVMPLLEQKKALWRYTSMPLLVQKWGLFSAHTLSDSEITTIAAYLKKSFALIDYRVDDTVNSIALAKHFTQQSRINYILHLNTPIDTIRNTYNTQTKRNLKTARESALDVRFDIPATYVVDLYKTHIASKDEKVSAAFYTTLPTHLQRFIENGKGQTAGVYKQNMLHAAAFYVHTGHSIINIFPASHPAGRDTQAMTLLVDTMLERYAGSPQVFDFEGSMIESIARFYKGFGAELQTYTGITYNRLPRWVRWIRR